MTRLSDNEKVMLTQAKRRAAVTRTASTGGIGAALAALAEPVLRPFRRAVILRQLQGLDDRLLADIGLQRWQIAAVADQAVGGRRPSLLAAAGRLAGGLVERAKLGRQKRLAYRELMSLDERMLRDIGIARGDIPAVIAGMGRRAGAVADGADPLDALRRWNRSRSAAKTLSALDNRMLDDMGFVRGDIDWVVEELAIRSLDPANRNRSAPRAA